MGAKELNIYLDEEMGLNNPSNPINPIEAIHEGEVLFARKTGILITPAHFSASNVIIKMSNIDTGGMKSGQTNVRARKATTYDEVVKDVLKISHRDIPQELLNKMMETVDIEYIGFEKLNEEEDDEIGTYLTELTSKYTNSDLLRGMDAFAEATWEHHDTIYDFTIIEPSRKFARWLIALEQNELE